MWTRCFGIVGVLPLFMIMVVQLGTYQSVRAAMISEVEPIDKTVTVTTPIAANVSNSGDVNANDLANTCTTTVALGQVVDCALEAGGDFDEYTFQGVTNDIFILRLRKTSGAFYPRLRVYDPNNVEICYDNGDPVAALSCSLSSSGIFTIRVDDYYNKSPGDYSIYVQKLNGVGSAQSVDFGQLYTADVERSIESDAYTFDALINNKIVLRVQRTSGDFYPRLRVYDENGNEVCYDNGEPLAAMVCEIKASGTYAILVDDYYISSTGDYQLFVQRLGVAGAAEAIQYGQSYDASLATSIETDSFVFNAEVNDQIFVRVQRNSGDMYVRTGIYDQDGDLVCYDDGQTLAIIEPCSISETGTYTIVIDDYYVSSTGTYTLHFQRVNNPGNASTINFGQTLSASIDPIANLDTYLITVNATDTFQIIVNRTAGDFYPRVRVYDSGGNRICYADGSPTAVLQNCAVDTTGQYIVLVDDYYVRNVGDYTLSLSCTSDQCRSESPTIQTVYLPIVIN